MGPISCNSRTFRPPHFQIHHNGPERENWNRERRGHLMRQFSPPFMSHCQFRPRPHLRLHLPPLPRLRPPPPQHFHYNNSYSPRFHPLPLPPPPPLHYFGRTRRSQSPNMLPAPYLNTWSPPQSPGHSHNNLNRSTKSPPGIRNHGPVMSRTKYLGGMKTQSQMPYNSANFRRVNSNKVSFLSPQPKKPYLESQQLPQPSHETVNFESKANLKKKNEFNHLWLVPEPLSVSPFDMENLDQSSTISSVSESDKSESDVSIDVEHVQNGVESQSFIIPPSESAASKTIGIFHYDEESYLEVYLFVKTISKFNKDLDKWQEIAVSGLWFGEKNRLNGGETFPISGKETVHSATIQAAGRVLAMIKNRAQYNKVRIYTNSSYLIENIKTWHANRANWANGTKIKETTWAEVKYCKEVNKLCNSLMTMAVQWSLTGRGRYGMKQAIKLCEEAEQAQAN